MQLFRGYVPTKDKQCLEKFKGRKRLNTLEEVQDLDEYAAILGDETILVEEVSQITDLTDLGKNEEKMHTEVRTMFLTTAMDCCWEMVSISSRSCIAVAL